MHTGPWHGATHFLARFLLETTLSTVVCSICAIRTSLLTYLLGKKRRCIELLYTVVHFLRSDFLCFSVLNNDLFAAKEGNLYALTCETSSEIPRNPPH